MDLEQAQKPLIHDLDGLRIGFCGFTEGHDLSGADKNIPGVAPWDPEECFRQVTELKKECDLVFVLPHGGIEFSAWPAPYCIDAYRRIAHRRGGRLPAGRQAADRNPGIESKLNNRNT